MGKTLSARKKDYLQITLGEKEAHKSHISQKKNWETFICKKHFFHLQKKERKRQTKAISVKNILGKTLSARKKLFANNIRRERGT